MLTELTISNFAIIDELSLQLTAGFNVLTGETGAGKSIIIDAVSLLLGGRADTTLVRAGAEVAQVDVAAARVGLEVEGQAVPAREGGPQEDRHLGALEHRGGQRHPVGSGDLKGRPRWGPRPCLQAVHPGRVLLFPGEPAVGRPGLPHYN